MKRIFSGAKSPMINITEKFNNELTSHTIERVDKPLNSTEQDQTSPELVPILTLLSAHLHRRYHEGVLLMLEDLKNDGTPGARKWEEMYAVLIGTQLALWNANDLNGVDETTLKNSATKPTYINFTDANIQCIDTVKGVSSQNNQKLENILVVSTTLKNRYFLQFSNRESFNQWNVAVRLSLYESTSLQEAYTGAFISSRGSRLSDIGVLLASTKFDYEEWVSVRFGVGMPWKRCYAVITQNVNKKKSAFGEINFYENDKKIKKQYSMTTVTHASAIYAVYPSSPKLIDNSTMIKLEGKAKFKRDDTVQETNLFIMPEKHEAVPCYDTIIRFLLPAMNAFRLYGRPKKLIANKDDPTSLLFALPTLPHIYYLQLEDLIPLTKSSDCLYWNSSEWKGKIRDILQTKLTKGYSGCGSSTSLKNILGTPFLESGELFQTSGNILSPLLRSANSKSDIFSPRLNGSKVYQHNNNTNGFKSSTSLKSSSSKSLESPLDLDEPPSLPKLPINANVSKKNVLSGKLSNPSQTPTSQALEIQKNIASPASLYPREKLEFTDQTLTDKTVPKNQRIVPETIKIQQTTRNNRTEESKKPQHTGAPILNQLETEGHFPHDHKRENNFIPLTVNSKEDDCLPSQKHKPEPLKLQHSNFDTFDNQFSVGNHQNKHTRAESSLSFLIDAYREIEDNNNYDQPAFQIKMKELNLSKENIAASSDHDVFDPEFVEQNQILEMENVYGSMMSKTQVYPVIENRNKEYKEKTVMKQEQATKHISTNNTNSKKSEDRDRTTTPTLTQMNSSNTTSNMPTQEMTYKKLPPPPPQQQPRTLAPSIQQPPPNRRQNSPLANQQTSNSPKMNINSDIAYQRIPNPYSMGEGSFSTNRVQPVPIKAQVPDARSNMQPQPLGYNQSPHYTPPGNYSSVFNPYSPNTKHRRPPVQQYQQPYMNNPKITPRTITPTTPTTTGSDNNSDMHRMVASQQQQQQQQQDRYIQKVSYNNTGNNNYALQNQYLSLNQKFPGPNPSQNYTNHQASLYSSNSQFNRHDNNNYYNCHNNQPPYSNTRPMDKNNPYNSATNRYTTPFRPQPPQSTTTTTTTGSLPSPQPRQFIRPKPVGFSQFMPSPNANNGTNPYGSYVTN